MHEHRGTGVLPWLLRALGEPTRRRVYLAVEQAGRPLSRAEVAERVGIAHRLATFHLDRLAEEGLLDVHYARAPGRAGGPGAGRPAKWYRPSTVQIDVTIPPRRSDLAARVMAAALEQVGEHGAARESLVSQANAVGHQLGADEHGEREPLAALATIGYRPVPRPDGVVEMLNCPFHAAKMAGPTTTCAMNLALIDGFLEERHAAYEAVLDPGADRCCVLLRPTTPRLRRSGGS
jgi:predicted ArsR family transcriptional regulator